MIDTGIIDIDSAEDMELMQIIAKYYFFLRNSEYKEIYDNAIMINREYTGKS